MKYTGGCHCGQVKFEVEAQIDKLLACNCSICHKRGHLLFFVPASNLKLLQGKDKLSDYQFAAKKIHHLFCSVCGVSSFGEGAMPDGTKMNSVNARCIDDLELSKFEVTNYDGKSL